jgi:hypothetical protein
MIRLAVINDRIRAANGEYPKQLAEAARENEKHRQADIQRQRQMADERARAMERLRRKIEEH